MASIGIDKLIWLPGPIRTKYRDKRRKCAKIIKQRLIHGC